MESEQPKNKGGRPEGSASRWSREARETARNDGDGRLPHEILLHICRGHPVELIILGDDGKPKTDADGVILYKLVYPTMEDIKDCAKSAAPYFAPKIATVELTAGATEDELFALAQELAAQAGITLGPSRAGEAEEAPARPRSNPAGAEQPARRRSVE